LLLLLLLLLHHPSATKREERKKKKKKVNFCKSCLLKKKQLKLTFVVDWVCFLLVFVSTAADAVRIALQDGTLPPRSNHPRRLD
jgi:hypothetical protein